jgi:nucleotide-binding universal stress UspA family protein
VTAKVLHAAEKPVITSAHFENQTSPLSIDRVLCAVDLGPQSARVLCWAARASKMFDAQLEIAHAAPDSGDSTGNVEEETWRRTAQHRLTEKVDELKRSVQVDARTLIEFDHPARAISALAKRSKSDLVVLGRGVSQGLIGRLRANAYDIIRQCPCPVVSV